MSEFIYILENPSMPNLVKIGKTERSVEERAQELSSHTGVPTGFVVIKVYPVANSAEAERIIHERLSDFRVADNREFFKIEAEDAMEIIESLLTIVKSATPIDFDREDELIERAIPIVITRGAARPRELESVLGISYQEALLVIAALRGRGITGPNNEVKWKEEKDRHVPHVIRRREPRDSQDPLRFDPYVLPDLELLERSARKAKVALRELLDSEEWVQSTAKIPIALGADVHGHAIVTDLAGMPHLLIGGEAGSGKSICINSCIASMLYRFTPEEIRFVMIDPRAVGMQIYNSLPHLVIPVFSDTTKVMLALRWVIEEMERRYRIFAKTGVGSITSFNARQQPKSRADKNAKSAKTASADVVVDFSEKSDDELFTEEFNPVPIRVLRDEEIIIPDKMPYIVVIIEDMDSLPAALNVEAQERLGHLAQNGRAAGIHLILSARQTKRNVVSESLKTSIPARVAFRCASRVESREILGEVGAEKLSDVGEILFRPRDSIGLVRARAALVTDEENQKLVAFISRQGAPVFEPRNHDNVQSSSAQEDYVCEEDEELVEKCIEIMRQEKKASTSLFQRRLRLGYTRAARVVDILVQRGYIADGEGAKPREILRDLEAVAQSYPDAAATIADLPAELRRAKAALRKEQSKKRLRALLISTAIIIVCLFLVCILWWLGFLRN